MIKRLFLFLLSLISIVSYSQDSTAYEKLLNNSRKFYLLQVNTYSTNFLEGLWRVGKFGLYPADPLFQATAKELKAEWPEVKGEELYYKLIDSIYTDIRNKYLWSGREVEMMQFKPLFELYNEKYCSCISQEKIRPEEFKAYARLSAKCDSILTTDIIFITSFRSKLSAIPTAEQGKVQPLISRYLYQYCPVFRTHTNAALLADVEGTIGNYLFMEHYRLPELVVSLYEQRSFDSLSRLFPAYANFKKDINAAITPTIKKAEVMKRTDRQSKELTTIITTTYYHKGKTTNILGQTICKINRQNALEPIITSYRFIETGKITNKQVLLKEIDEEVAMPPPPPQEELLPPPVKKN